jgi:hypothetical protein
MPLSHPSSLPSQNGSEPCGPPPSTAAASVQHPPVDEICRILARVLSRVQASPPPDPTPAAGDAS